MSNQGFMSVSSNSNGCTTYPSTTAQTPYSYPQIHTIQLGGINQSLQDFDAGTLLATYPATTSLYSPGTPVTGHSYSQAQMLPAGFQHSAPQFSPTMYNYPQSVVRPLGTHTTAKVILPPLDLMPADIQGRVSALARQQSGSRGLQRLLTKCDDDTTHKILDECLSGIISLMCDPYGNYMMQSLFKKLDMQHKKEVVSHMRRNNADIVAVATDPKGTHALQALIENMVGQADQQAEDDILNLLHGHVIQLTKDSVGSHVIQHILTSCSSYNAKCIAQEAVKEFGEMVSSGHGICVAKKIMSKVEVGGVEFTAILKILMDHAVDLAQHPYANFAVQYAMQYWPIEHTTALMHQYRGWLMQLATQKFASNVAETLLETAGFELREDFLAELLDESRLPHIMKSSYGIYVAQKAISLQNQSFNIRFNELISRHLDNVPSGRLHKRWCALVSEEYVPMQDTNARMKEIQNNLGQTRPHSGPPLMQGNTQKLTNRSLDLPLHMPMFNGQYNSPQVFSYQTSQTQTPVSGSAAATPQNQQQ